MATKRKTKRFSGGGMSDEDVKSFAGTPDNDSNAGMAMESGMMEKEPDENFKSTPKAKAPIVTKEQLVNSGLSLRDYMNKQQGLTRRKDPAPKNEGMSMTRMDPEKAQASKRQGELEVLRDTALRTAEGERAVKAHKEKQKTAAEAAAAASLGGYKRGGVIKSSASSRGDGIAQRGKTRGTIVMCGGGMARKK